MLQSVFNRLRMNLWVIRSGRENPSQARRPLPSREMAQKELPSTPLIEAFPLVNQHFPTPTRCQSPGRYPGSPQAHRVSPTGLNSLSTGPVDNKLFRGPPTAYGFRVDLARRREKCTCQCMSLVFRTRIRLAPRRGVRGARGPSSGSVRSKGECCRGDAALQR